jgi:integrase
MVFMGRKKKVTAGDGTWGLGNVRQRGDKHQVRWYENGERRSRSGYLSEAEATTALDLILANVRAGKPGFTEAAPVLVKSKGKRFADLVPDWIEHRRKHEKTSADEDATRWAKHLATALEPHDVGALTSKWIRDWAVELVKPSAGSKGPDGKRRKGVSGPTAHRVLTLLSSFYSWAQDEGHASANPAREAVRHGDTKRLTRSKYDKDARPFLKSWAEVDALYAALKDQDPTVATYYLIGARAGLRPGEVLGLRWSDVDLGARTIYVERQVRSGKLGATKGRKARKVPMGATLASRLATGRGDAKDSSLVCPPPVRVKKNGTSGKAWGQYLGPKSIGPAWTAALEAAGLESADVYDYGRRSFGSIMGLDPTVSVWRLQEIMGHASVTTTQRYVALRGRDLSSAEVSALG